MTKGQRDDLARRTHAASGAFAAGPQRGVLVSAGQAPSKTFSHRQPSFLTRTAPSRSTKACAPLRHPSGSARRCVRPGRERRLRWSGCGRRRAHGPVEDACSAATSAVEYVLDEPRVGLAKRLDPAAPGLLVRRPPAGLGPERSPGSTRRPRHTFSPRPARRHASVCVVRLLRPPPQERPEIAP
jgi:hypothetical protein